MNVVAEAYVLGVSTRKVEELVAAMGAKGMSKSEISWIASTLDADVAAFQSRKLEKPYPYVWLDALYVKVREGGRTLSKAVTGQCGREPSDPDPISWTEARCLSLLWSRGHVHAR